jgi:hypothetical protein
MLAEHMKTRESLLKNQCLNAAIYFDPRIKTILNDDEKNEARTHLKKLFNLVQSMEHNESITVDNSAEESPLEMFLMEFERSITNENMSITEELLKFEMTPRMKEKKLI